MLLGPIVLVRLRRSGVFDLVAAEHDAVVGSGECLAVKVIGQPSAGLSASGGLARRRRENRTHGWIWRCWLPGYAGPYTGTKLETAATAKGAPTDREVQALLYPSRGIRPLPVVSSAPRELGDGPTGVGSAARRNGTAAKGGNVSRVASALPHSEGGAYKRQRREVAPCWRDGRMGS